MLPHERMNDRALISLYENIRHKVRSVECERIRRELERRARADGGVVSDAERGICYVWDPIEESLVRRVFHREPVKRQPRIYKARAGTVVPSSGVARARKHRRGHRHS